MALACFSSICQCELGRVGLGLLRPLRHAGPAGATIYNIVETGTVVSIIRSSPEENVVGGWPGQTYTATWILDANAGTPFSPAFPAGSLGRLRTVLPDSAGKRGAARLLAHAMPLRLDARNGRAALREFRMTEPAQTPQIPDLDNLFGAPVIYFDAVPTIGMRGPVLTAVLAVRIGEPTTSTQVSDHVVAVANLRFTLETGAQFRDLLDKMLLAAAKTPGQAN